MVDKVSKAMAEKKVACAITESVVVRLKEEAVLWAEFIEKVHRQVEVIGEVEKRAAYWLVSLEREKARVKRLREVLEVGFRQDPSKELERKVVVVAHEACRGAGRLRELSRIVSEEGRGVEEIGGMKRFLEDSIEELLFVSKQLSWVAPRIGYGPPGLI